MLCSRVVSRWPWLLPALMGAGLLLAAITLGAHLARPRFEPLPQTGEIFDPLLVGLNSVDEIMLALETAYPHATPLQKLEVADDVLRRRFVHSYSYFRFDHNWSAAALRLFWDDLASPVRPDDILRYRRAACSQQAIVFEEIARRLGFTYASVGLPDHFMAAVQVEGRWWVFDANKEVTVRRYPFEWLVNADPRLGQLYSSSYAPQLLSQLRKGEVSLNHVNANPAPQATALHILTDLFSKFAWLLVLGLWLLLKIGSTVARRASVEEASEASCFPIRPRQRHRAAFARR